MSASTPKTFDSRMSVLGSFKDDWSGEELKSEPMFFNSSVAFAMLKGGPVMRSFLNAIPEGWEDAVVDSRVHMLMPGWYPAIPGYHHDDVPRPPIPVGQHFLTAAQPDYDNPRYKSEHLLGLANGNICPTAFAVGECTMPAIPDGQLIYREWHKEVQRLVACGELTELLAPSGRVIAFDWQSFHTGTKAVGNGWRWFCRLTRNSDRCRQITNEIRQQVQVYLEFPMEGW